MLSFSVPPGYRRRAEIKRPKLDADLVAMLARAAEEGARRALNDVGLGGKDAVLTIHDMQSLGLMYQTHQTLFGSLP